MIEQLDRDSGEAKLNRLRELAPPDSHCASDCCDSFPRLHLHGNHDEWNEIRAALLSERQENQERIAELELAATHAFRFVSAAIDKASYGDSTESDLLEVHHSLQEVLPEPLLSSSGGDKE